MLKIENRRYIGSKKSLTGEIFSSITKYINSSKFTFADMFAGTGVVSSFMMDKGIDVIVNDILYSNYVAHNTWMGSDKVDRPKIEKMIDTFNKINAEKLKPNYFSKIYGDKYFSENDAKKIGHIRNLISKAELTERESHILIASLIYAADKIANTVGHFEHFLSRKPITKNPTMKMPLIKRTKSRCTIYSIDANKLAEKIKCDVVYIDPPYNARQYVNFYHVLENLANWKKPRKFEGVSMKFKRDNLKSGYSRSKAPMLMEDLIKKLDAKLIIVSYNNTYSANSSASNNRISENQLESILRKKGQIKDIKEIRYKHFNSGKTRFKNHMEKIYVCKTA